MTSLDDIYDNDWVREPPGDYSLDGPVTHDDVLGPDGQPMLVIMGGEIHGWDDATGNFTRLPYDIDQDGKVVARADNC